MANSLVSAILAQAARDMMNRVGTNHAAAIDYCNRAQKDIIDTSNWDFMLAARKRFVTELGRTDYWVGTGSPTEGTGYVTTGLNITDLQRFKKNTLRDISNGKILQETKEVPTSPRFAFPDGSPRPGRPALWRHSPDIPDVLSLYPAPDNQNNYTPVPAAAELASTAGGSAAARTVFVTVTFVDAAGGESIASTEARIYLAASTLVKVRSPIVQVTPSAGNIGYTSYNVYAGTTSGSLTKQNLTLQTIGTDWTEPAGGLIVGVAAPTSSTLEPVRGYVIEFRYYKTPAVLTLSTDTVAIPPQYEDTLVARINWYLAQYLERHEKVPFWDAAYQMGLAKMVRARRMAADGPDYVRPDRSAIGGYLPSGFYLDNSL